MWLDGRWSPGCRLACWLDTTLLVSECNHVRHDAVVRQFVDCLELLLQGEGASDEPLLLLIYLNFDVFLDACVQFGLHNLYLFVRPIGFAFPVRQMHFILFVFRLLEVFSAATLSTTLTIGALPTTRTVHFKFDLQLGVGVVCQSLVRGTECSFENVFSRGDSSCNLKRVEARNLDRTVL